MDKKQMTAKAVTGIILVGLGYGFMQQGVVRLLNVTIEVTKKD